MKNHRLTILYLLAGYILPLLPRVALLGCYKIWLLMLACVVMLAWANPEISMSDGKRNVAQDRGTMLWIFSMGYLALVAPVVEWGYFMGSCAWTHWTTLGLLLTIAGLAYRIYAINTLGKHFTGVVKQVSGHTLVTSGPYTYLRHPSYLGSVVTFAGCAVLLEAWIGLVLCNILMLFAYYLRITAEEKLLTGIFGENYKQYQSKTWRLVPFVW